jgi:Tat protein translocase TatC
MPFLDHLEELRWRILWSMIAVVLGTVLGYFLVQHFDLIGLLKRPIEPFLPTGRLMVTRPADAFLITLKLSVVIGIVVGLPVIIWHLWRFLAPALYERERRFMVPALFAGLSLFVTGVVIAYRWVLPAALRILLGFASDDLETLITADAYFTFAAQLILAFGAMFELPLVIVLLAATGLVSPDFFRKHRPIAFVIAAVVSAFLTPPDPLSMMMMLGPLMLLYEGGILVARLVWRSKREATIGALLVFGFLTFGAGDAAAQRDSLPPRGERRPAVAQDTATARGQPMDTAAARRLGLPTAPSRSFPAEDSILRQLMALPGFKATRYASDSLVFHADSQAIQLMGHALIEQEGAMLEADSVDFRQNECRLDARGHPTLFQEGTVLIGRRMHYDTCARIGYVGEALTSFEQGGVEWILRAGQQQGGLSIDSASVRIYAGHSDITSCDLPNPHYHFAAGSVKWVSNRFMVARPAVLYVRDVPILWLPFIFQDMRVGRRSGLLAPRFGINDLVRTNPGYRRHFANIGYYFAISDYVDAQASVDWFDENYVQVNGQVRYRWLNRFLGGGLAVSRIFESGRDGVGGSRSLRLRWNHRQNFDLQTSLNAEVDYANSAQIIERNATDPYQATATLGSTINFTKRFDWGSLALGASRSQELTSGGVSQVFPSFSITPASLSLSEAITWSPSFSVTNTRTFNQRGAVEPLPPLPGDSVLPVDTLEFGSRNTTLSLGTPLTIGRWTWTNSVNVTDVIQDRRETLTLVDSVTGDTTVQTFGYTFATDVNWETGINLPIVFANSWKVTPRLGVTNTTSGPLLLRNRNTQGDFVAQGKRVSVGATLAPQLFAFFPGLGPVERIRHQVSPFVTWAWAPVADVPEAYARAVAGPGGAPLLRSPAQQRVSVGLSQVLEGKLALPPGDTTSDPRNAPKIKLLSLQTGAITYDFEQAKEEGRTGWQTPTLSNQLTSDLLPGFSVSLTHELWEGAVGTDSAVFRPHLNRVSARFSLSEATFGSVLGLLTGRPRATPARQVVSDTAATPEELLPNPTNDPYNDHDRRPLAERSGRRPMTAAITFESTRPRPVSGETATIPVGARTLGLALGFDPTPNWSVSWTTQVDLDTGEFGQHALRLERDLHRWRATFQFLKAPNGNFAFNFFISLLDQPEIKFQYDQQTVER